MCPYWTPNWAIVIPPRTRHDKKAHLFCLPDAQGSEEKIIKRFQALGSGMKSTFSKKRDRDWSIGAFFSLL